ncbi:MAG: hypothetical protein AAGG56_02125 [Pseudomonadota bacterium]
MIRSALLCAFGLLVASPAAFAGLVDLNNASRQNKTYYCAYYVVMEAQIELRMGVIDQAEFNDTRNAMSWEVSRGFSGNVGHKLDRAGREILEAEPTVQEIRAAAAECRVFLRR